MIYFMQITDVPSAVKIGYSADPARRAQQLGWQVGGTLELLAAAPGRIPQEADIHRKFAHLRLKALPEPFRITGNEWFAVDDDLSFFIGHVAQTGALPLALHERRHDYVLSLLDSGLSRAEVARRIGVRRQAITSMIESINWHRRFPIGSIAA